MSDPHIGGTNPDCDICLERHWNNGHGEGNSLNPEGDCVWCLNLRESLVAHGIPSDLIEGLLTMSREHWDEQSLVST